MKNLLIFVFALIILASPVVSLAYDPAVGLVPCGKSDSTGNISNPCDFEDFIALINGVIDFILFYLAVPIAAIMFAYAGFLLVTAQGGEAKTKAKKIFTNALLGLIFAAAAWIIIKTLLSIAGYKEIGLFF